MNLHESHSTSSGIIRCLPNGAKLAVADFSHAPIELNHPIYRPTHNEEYQWLWAETEQGEMGWVELSAGDVTWAE